MNARLLAVLVMFCAIALPAAGADGLAPQGQKLLLAAKDPDCVRSCGYQLNGCRSGCSGSTNSCKQACRAQCRLPDNQEAVWCINACYLNCEGDSGCIEGCLSEHKGCVASCPEK